MAGELERELRAVRDTLLDNPVSPRVEDPRDINAHYCRYVAETVVDRVDDRCGAEFVEDGGRGFAHTWITCEGRHYDAECVEGVDDYRALPFFRRRPEAAIHPDPGSTRMAALRRRGVAPLYPTQPSLASSDGSHSGSRFDDVDFGTAAIACVLLGVTLLLVGVLGTWAIDAHLVRVPAWEGVLFHDLEVVGVLIGLLAPTVLTVIRPERGPT